MSPDGLLCRDTQSSCTRELSPPPSQQGRLQSWGSPQLSQDWALWFLVTWKAHCSPQQSLGLYSWYRALQGAAQWPCQLPLLFPWALRNPECHGFPPWPLAVTLLALPPALFSQKQGGSGLSFRMRVCLTGILEHGGALYLLSWDRLAGEGSGTRLWLLLWACFLLGRGESGDGG